MGKASSLLKKEKVVESSVHKGDNLVMTHKVPPFKLVSDDFHWLAANILLQSHICVGFKLAKIKFKLKELQNCGNRCLIYYL